MKIILLGYMGCGKSTIGKLLAKQLDLPFIDLDSYMEKQEKMSIKDIFSEKGEVFFRKIEGKYLSNLLNSTENYVLSLGGGTPCFGNNIKKILSSNSISFYLKYKTSTLSERLAKEKNQRPIISHLKDDELIEFINKHLFERNSYYNKANHCIQSDGKTPEEIITLIKEYL